MPKDSAEKLKEYFLHGPGHHSLCWSVINETAIFCTQRIWDRLIGVRSWLKIEIEKVLK